MRLHGWNGSEQTAMTLVEEGGAMQPGPASAKAAPSSPVLVSPIRPYAVPRNLDQIEWLE